MQYLNRERWRVVERNDRGVVKYRKSFKFGDEISDDVLSHVDPDHVEALKNSGVLVSSQDDLRVRRNPLAPIPGAQVTGSATGEAADHSEIAEPTADDGDDGEMVDQYTSMDYSELQQEAKRRDLSAGGSAEDIRDRLREDDGEA